MGEMERRQFVRVRMDVPVRYKLVRPTGEKVLEDLFEGNTNNISTGGLLLQGKLPDPSYVIELLAQRVRIALNMAIPGDTVSIKAIARAAWIERLEASSGVFPMGLSFEHLDDADRARIQRFTIKAQIG